MKKILVIGGAGFIGSHTVLALSEGGYEPVILDNFSNSEQYIVGKINKLAGKKIPIYTSDYRNKDVLKKILQDEEIDGVVHFASFKAVGESIEQPLKYYSNNVSGFVDLLGLLLECNVNNFVFSSSAAVYGNPDDTLVSEDTACRPTSPYGWSKYFDEIILSDTCSSNDNFKGIALRYFNVVGAHPSGKIGELPKGKPQNLLPIIINALNNKTPITIFGSDYPTKDGTCLRDYIHVMDLASAHVKALDYTFKNSGLFDVFNVGTGEPTKVKELINTFERVNKVNVPFVLGDRRAGDPAAYYALNSKATSTLGWKSQYSIEDAVKHAFLWNQSMH